MQITPTIVIIAVTILMSLAAWNNETLLSNWIMNPVKVTQNKQYYRFLTSGFIHADYMHLFFNMFTFYSFGTLLENVFQQIFGDNGKFYFLALYLVGIIVSDIPSYLKHKNDRNYNSLGASGGVSAVLFAGILFIPTATLYIYFIPMPAIIFAVLYFIYSFYQMRNGRDNVNHSAHIWGAIFGAAFCLIVYPPVAQIFWEQIINWRMFK